MSFAEQFENPQGLRALDADMIALDAERMYPSSLEQTLLSPSWRPPRLKVKEISLV
ncbi:hypothetical protein DPMN_188220 [Dreissena polymorpha]|uniref:Uncharacterized protein n=1 Tax=Dreissena polymorpha TaxID=45954 RepID=A0A9D4I9Q8_DREPO|nr:hypothetical protein DPMN_188220 [Dreissena polymorpha]